MTYALTFRPSVLKRLKKMPAKDVMRLKQKLDDLAEKHQDTDKTKIKGNNPLNKVIVG